MAWIATIASALIGAGSQASASSKAGTASDLAAKQAAGAGRPPYQSTASQLPTRMEDTARSLGQIPRMPEPTNTFGNAMQQHPGIAQPAVAPVAQQAPPIGAGVGAPPQQQPQQGGTDWMKYAQLGQSLASFAKPQPVQPVLNRPAPAAPYEPTAQRFGRRSRYPTY